MDRHAREAMHVAGPSATPSRRGAVDSRRLPRTRSGSEPRTVTLYALATHRIVAWLFVAGILLQAYLAGTAISQLGGSGDFGQHRAFGYAGLGLLALAVVATALAARVDRTQLGLTIGLLVVYLVQTLLPAVRAEAPWVSALHAANALVLFGVGLGVALRARRFGAKRAPGA
jgi:hypothetical protein